MSNNIHTPEPWKVFKGDHKDPNCKIITNDGVKVAAFTWWVGLNDIYCCENFNANAARIVACVNACAGMEDPETEIPALRMSLDEAADIIACLTKENEELKQFNAK